MRHLAGAMIGAVVVALLAAGCTPEPAPSPSPTGFASEEEAFAAAEATYRAYVDALNQVDLSDPATFEAVYEQLSGSALADERKSLTTLHAEGSIVEGETVLSGFWNKSGTDPLTGIGCLDVSAVSLTDASGASLVDPNRPSKYALELTFSPDADGRSLRINSSMAVTDARCE